MIIVEHVFCFGKMEIAEHAGLLVTSSARHFLKTCRPDMGYICGQRNFRCNPSHEFVMRSIRTLTVAPDVAVWLANTHLPRILHVFARACNLINEQGEVISIVTCKIGNGPFNLVIEEELLPFENLHVDSQVIVLDHQLIVGDQILNISDTKIWSPCPDWKKLYDHRDDIAGHLASLPVHQSESPHASSSQLSAALARGDVLSSKAFASQLAGLGVGLTPAGDDFIMGALHASWIIHPLKAAENLAMEVANAAAPRTTSLSGAWLWAAGSGKAGELWHEFFEALALSHSVRTRTAMEKIMSLGVTSGVEALAGFSATFHAYWEIKQNDVIPGSISCERSKTAG